MSHESKLRFISRGRDLLAPATIPERRRAEPRIEPLESRIAPAVVGGVTTGPNGVEVQLTGDGANDTFSFGVNGGNLTHTFPTGPGNGFDSAEDFDSTQPGVQTVPAGATTRVTISGGAGFDKVDFGGLESPLRIDVGDGNSAIGFDGSFSFGGVESVSGSKAGDNIRVKVKPDEPVVVNGGDGDDTIRAAGDGQITLEGGAGNDKIDASNKGDIRIRGGNGDDTLTGKGDRLLIEGDAGDDEINVKAGRGAIVVTDGGDGNDLIRGGRANSTLFGGMGNDTVLGGSGSELILGDDGDDSLKGGGGEDTVDGGDGTDTVEGGGGRNTISGGTGEDLLIGGRTTVLHEQSDLGFLTLADNKLILSDGKFEETDTLHKVSNVLLEGGPGNDRLDATGFNFSVTLRGGLGDDELFGGRQSAKSSAFFEVLGTDTVTGAGKRDGLLIIGDGAFKLENNLLTSNTATAELTGIDFASFEAKFSGGIFVDASNVTDFPIQLLGGSGNDQFIGGSKNDIFFGGDGNDVLVPSFGRDRFVGGPGNNVVSGNGADHGVQIVYNGRAGLVQLLDEQGKADRNSKASISQVSVFEGSEFGDLFRITAPSKIDFQIDAGDGNDTIFGAGPGGLFINAGDGNDVVISRQSFGFINLEGGDDKLTIGSRFGMFVNAGPGADDILGGPGNDTFALQDNEADTVDGGGGKDSASTQDDVDVLKNIP